jgi:hypothetical protein
MSPNADPAFGAPKTMHRPPAEPGALTPESARQAVESAFGSVPFDPAGHPEERSGAEPMGPVLHQPPAYENGTPSLNLPGTPGDTAPPVPPPPMTPPEQAAPPPTPPPLMPPPSL